MDDADLIVLGMGPGGESVAQMAAKAGRRVVGIDPGLVGGECPYYGCIPSKMILRAAETLAEAGRVDALAGHATTEADYTPVADRIRDEATDDWDDTVAVERFENAGGTFVRGAGRLVGRDDHGHVVVTVGEKSWHAPAVVIATGTDPVVPPIDGLAELRASADGLDSPIWTNREVVKTREVPKSLIVLGGGAIGCELAQGFARFGANVTLVEAAPRILSVEEPETSRVITDVFTDEGITVLCDLRATQVAASDNGGVVVRLEGDDNSVTGDKLLVAAGRHTNIDDIGLGSLGVADEDSSLTIDEHMQVLDERGKPVDGLYAVGDVTGHGGFTHVADWQAKVLSDHLLERDEHFGGYHGLAWVTFTDPEVGRVGMTEAQALDAGLTPRIGRTEISSNSRGWIHGPGNDGFVKLVVDPDAGVLVGATIVAPHGGEVIGLCTLAVHARVPIDTLATMHYAFPTLHRAVLEALKDLH